MHYIYNISLYTTTSNQSHLKKIRLSQTNLGRCQIFIMKLPVIVVLAVNDYFHKKFFAYLSKPSHIKNQVKTEAATRDVL